MIGWVNTAFTKLWAWYSGLVGYFKFGEGGAGGFVEEIHDMEAAHGEYRDGVHAFGGYSYACRTSYANAKCGLHIRASQASTFLGIYDGNGTSNEAAKFLGRNLHLKITDKVRLGAAVGLVGTVDLDTIAMSINEIETDYKAHVEAEGISDPTAKNIFASSGSSCLVIVILADKILIANLGDGKAVCVREYGVFNMRLGSTLEVLNGEKNVNNKRVRDDLVKKLVSRPNLVLREGTWRVNDEIEVCESIGNLNLKFAEFASENVDVAEGPVVSSDVHTKSMKRNGYIRYLVVGNNEFWKFLSENQVMSAVKNHGRQAGIAHHLMELVVQESARVEREISGDIVIAVVFLDRLEPQMIGDGTVAGNISSMGGAPRQSYRDSF